MHDHIKEYYVLKSRQHYLRNSSTLRCHVLHLPLALCLLCGVQITRATSRYNNFGINGTNDGIALAFSTDGSVVYIATAAETVLAFGSTAEYNDPPIWSAAAGDSNLCDIVVSPDGLSVRLSRYYEAARVVHLRLNRCGIVGHNCMVAMFSLSAT